MKPLSVKMKRYRILHFDFNSSAQSFEAIDESWDENVKNCHIENRRRATERLRLRYGEQWLDNKIQNFIELQSKPFSVAAFHNKFLEQVRNAYVVDSYYPALTGACALGERILNHMIILLRDYHKATPEYKRLYRKKSFDDWPPVIDALESWGELLPGAASKFRCLKEKRNNAIHFNPETDHNDKVLALEAIHLIQDIVAMQFSAVGPQPWYFYVPGEVYIKKEWENKPLIKHIFIPSSLRVGPCHNVESVFPLQVADDFSYENTEISDEEFCRLRRSFLAH